MQKFLGLLIKDTLLIIKNYFFYVTVVIAVLFILAVNFIIPESLNMEPTVYITSEDLKVNQNAFQSNDRFIQLDSRESVYTHMKENINSIGIVIKEPYEVEYILQGHESEKIKNILLLETRYQFGEFTNDTDIQVTSLKGSNEEKIPFNFLLIPVFLVMEPTLLGLFLIATMVLSEKEEGTLNAYAVTPGNFTAFLISKEIVLIILGLLSLIVVTIFTVGFKVHFTYLILLTITGSIMGSSIGLLLTSLFNNLTKAMTWIMTITILLTLPIVSYMAPSFAPAIFKAIPVYPLLFAFKEALFYTGNTSLIINTSIMTFIIGIIAFIAARILYVNRLAD